MTLVSCHDRNITKSERRVESAFRLVNHPVNLTPMWDGLLPSSDSSSDSTTFWGPRARSLKEASEGAHRFQLITSLFQSGCTVPRSRPKTCSRPHSAQGSCWSRGFVNRNRLALRELRTEREVLNLVVSGMINKQIAAELGASEATVKMHRSQVMKKMLAQSLPELVRMADKLKSIT
jgi:DNA-binding NarL/FixJ family response regulator